MGWIYLSIFYRYYKLIIFLNKRILKFHAAFNACLLLSAVASMIFYTILHLFGDKYNFSLKKYIVFIILFLFVTFTCYLVFKNPGLSKIEERFTNETHKQFLLGITLSVFLPICMMVLILI
jgi:hypothetical protein